MARAAVLLGLIIGLMGFSLSALRGDSSTEVHAIHFNDVTVASGLISRQSYGDRRLDNIVEGTGTGVCVFDYNNDGYLDIFFPNGKWTAGVSSPDDRDLKGKLKNHLFRNNGNGTFTDVTDEAGLGGSQYSVGCAAGDYDNDGFVDLLVLNYGQNELFHNDGNGHFTEVATKAGLTGAHFSLSAVWYDYNNDGYLDLYIGNYVQYDETKSKVYDPLVGYPGPLTYTGESNLLYRNNGDGTFTDVTKEMGVWKPEGRSMSVTAADFNNDGRLELLSANDAMQNYYFEMDSSGVYRERSLEMNLAYSENGAGVSHMGPVVGDINRDGRLDLYFANLRDCSLLIQRPDGKGFANQTGNAGLAVNKGQYSGWAAMLYDFDHDGWLDLFNTNGSAQHEYGQENTIFRNRGDGRFEDVSGTAGPHFHEKHVGRGGTGIDFDNDGRMDLVIVNLNDRAILLKNETRTANHWITVTPRLKFPTGVRDAYGARVTVVANGLRMIEDMIPTRGYLSAGDPRLNFGLGQSDHADLIEIRWPDGQVDQFKDVRGDRFVVYTHNAVARRPGSAGSPAVQGSRSRPRTALLRCSSPCPAGSSFPAGFSATSGTPLH
ncbi:MAG: CRTAC1 family protein [Bryobacteraceae bacterium]